MDDKENVKKVRSTLTSKSVADVDALLITVANLCERAYNYKTPWLK